MQVHPSSLRRILSLRPAKQSTSIMHGHSKIESEIHLSQSKKQTFYPYSVKRKKELGLTCMLSGLNESPMRKM